MTETRRLNKVPEITLWFWLIKILCTTVGESLADYINETLGFGLINTSVLFTAVFLVVLGVQLKLTRYVPFPYWLTVAVVSVTGTLCTDILTDRQGVPLRTSTTVFAVALAVVFAVWWAKERTLSIHSITTLPRELFYWLAVLVTFALGTAAGDWTLELTGWSPGKSVLLPAALIAVVTLAWRAGGQPVLAFWLAYILTRPLGANIGDWFATPKSDGGLGVGTALTSLIFLAAIAATVVYLTVTRVDVTRASAPSTPRTDRSREAFAFGIYVVAAVVAALVLHDANSKPHTSALDAEEGKSTSTVQLTPAEATKSFPPDKVAELRTDAKAISVAVAAGDQKTAGTAATALETLWDDDEDTLKPLDGKAWTFLDGEIDDVLSAVRAKTPDTTEESDALSKLTSSLG